MSHADEFIHDLDHGYDTVIDGDGGDLSQGQMQLLSIARAMIADEPVMPTSELPTHLALQNYLLESGSCYKATLHTHPIELVAMSHIQRFLKGDEMTRVLWSMIPETLAFAPLGIGIVPYGLPSSVELSRYARGCTG